MQMSSDASESAQRWQDASAEINALADQLVSQHYPYIYRVAYSFLHDSAEAEDVAQDTFVAGLLHLEQSDPSKSFNINYKSLLSTIAVNKCRDLLRKRKTVDKFASLWRMVRIGSASSVMPEQETARSETAQHLWETVDQLHEKHRMPIVLRYVHNLSVREIATILDMKEGTVHSRIHYACKQLGRQLSFQLTEEQQALFEEVAR